MKASRYLSLFLLVAASLATSQSAKKPDKQPSPLLKIESVAVDFPGGAGQAPLRMSLAEVMKAYNVPGLSLAVIDNYKIVDAKAYGVTDAASKTPVTTRTLFQAGSISKPVAALGALSLVEQGKLSLDEDVNAKLKTWKVPEDGFTVREKVTLRRLMSHTGGLTVHGFPGYDVNDPLPTLVQVLNGEKPANTPPIRVDVVPGTKQRYSGGGVTIEQLLMIDVTGKAFPALMRDLVLDKIGMSDSSYEQPLPPARAAMTAGGTYADGKAVHGRWHLYPEMAAAGLWTTPTDLAKFAIEVGLSRSGHSNKVISEKMTWEMLSPVMEEAGLGVFLDKNNPGQFGHSGSDEGFRALLTMNADTGKGLVVMADSDNGIGLANLLLERVAKEYGWSYTSTEKHTGEGLYLAANRKGLSAAMERYDALKKSADAPEPDTLGLLGYRLLFSGKEADAIAVLERNVKELPESANAYDGLGEAYEKVGRRGDAIRSYEKALELNPHQEGAAEKLKKLKEDEVKAVDESEFTVIGISARTNNAKEMTADGVIGKMWGRLFQEGLIAKIPNKADTAIVAVYTDYASDHNGDYMYVLGARVTSDSEVPSGMVAKKIPGGKFARFTTEKGPAATVVPEMWMKINSLPAGAVGADRTYRADYEVYDQRAMDPQNVVVEVRVGVK